MEYYSALPSSNTHGISRIVPFMPAAIPSAIALLLHLSLSVQLHPVVWAQYESGPNPSECVKNATDKANSDYKVLSDNLDSDIEAANQTFALTSAGIIALGVKETQEAIKKIRHPAVLAATLLAIAGKTGLLIYGADLARDGAIANSTDRFKEMTGNLTSSYNALVAACDAAENPPLQLLPNRGSGNAAGGGNIDPNGRPGNSQQYVGNGRIGESNGTPTVTLFEVGGGSGSGTGGSTEGCIYIERDDGTREISCPG